ncbi:hypothetical protein HZS_1888 [Henneguya salminicola]|nr:hypothetical protein HZS_1888 [Henneguya salminicola]
MLTKRGINRLYYSNHAIATNYKEIICIGIIIRRISITPHIPDNIRGIKDRKSHTKTKSTHLTLFN